MGDLPNSVKFYKEVLQHDNTQVEAIACIGTNYFYSDQPEVALKFFRYFLKQLIILLFFFELVNKNLSHYLNLNPLVDISVTSMM